jgi:hypothetical protein
MQIAEGMLLMNLVIQNDEIEKHSLSLIGYNSIGNQHMSKN